MCLSVVNWSGSLPVIMNLVLRQTLHIQDCLRGRGLRFGNVCNSYM